MLPSDVIFYATKNDLKCTFVHYKNSIAIGYGEKYFSSFLCLTKDKEKELGHNVNYLNCKNKLWLRNARHFFVVNVRLVSLYISLLYIYIFHYQDCKIHKKDSSLNRNEVFISIGTFRIRWIIENNIVQLTLHGEDSLGVLNYVIDEAH